MSTGEAIARSPRAKPVRVAEMVAAQLRERILSNSLPGGMLPKQDELMAMFGVSGPSLREALRILEVEGLVTVRRGKVGGAEIHRPDGGSVANAIGLTLQGERTHLRELAEALLLFEPVCASAIAQNDEGIAALTPLLDDNLARTADALGDGPTFTHLSRAFHDLVVDSTPNQAVRLLVRSLVTVWSTQEEAWASEAVEGGQYPDIEGQRAVLAAHRRIAENITKGNPVAAERAARKHLEATQELVLAQFGDRIIDATSPRAMEGFRTMSFGADAGSWRGGARTAR